MQRMMKLGKSADLNELQQHILMAHYYLRSQPSSEDYLRESRWPRPSSYSPIKCNPKDEKNQERQTMKKKQNTVKN